MPPKTADECLQSLAASTANLLALQTGGKLLKLPKLEDDIVLDEWINEVETLIQDKFDDLGYALIDDLDHSLAFTLQHDGTYTVTDDRNSLDPAEAMIEKKIFRALKASAKGAALRRLKMFMASPSVTDPAGTEHVGNPAFANMACLVWRVLKNLDPQDYDQRKLEFHKLKCRSGNTEDILTHLDALVAKYNEIKQTAPPIHMPGLEPELAQTALSSLPIGIYKTVEMQMLATAWHARKVSSVVEWAKLAAKSRGHSQLAIQNTIKVPRIEHGNAASTSKPPKTSTKSKKPNTADASPDTTLRSRKLTSARKWCVACDQPDHTMYVCTNDCRKKGCNGKGGKHGKTCAIGKVIANFKRSAKLAWGDRDSSDDEAPDEQDIEDYEAMLARDATEDLDAATGNATSNDADEDGDDRVQPCIEHIAALIRAEHTRTRAAKQKSHDMQPVQTTTTTVPAHARPTNNECPTLEQADTRRLNSLAGVTTESANSALENHFSITPAPIPYSDEPNDATLTPTPQDDVFHDAPEHPFCSLKGYRKFVRRHCRLTPNEPIAPTQSRMHAVVDYVRDTGHHLLDTAAYIAGEARHDMGRSHTFHANLSKPKASKSAAALFGLALMAQLITGAPSSEIPAHRNIFEPNSCQQAFQLRQQRAKLARPPIAGQLHRHNKKPPWHQLTLPIAPKGWKYASMAVDSGCSIHILTDADAFLHLQRSNINICTANNDSVRVQKEGQAILHTFDANMRPTSILLERTVCSPKLKSLLSVSALLKQKCNIHLLHDRPSYIETPTKQRIRIREDADGLFYLDFLVPESQPNTHTHPAHNEHHGYFSTPTPTKYCVEICAGTSSALRYHALDPTSKLLAIDVLPPDKWRTLMKRVTDVDTLDRIQYHQLDVERLTPQEYASILHKTWQIKPADVAHVWLSPMCETLSLADRKRDRHYREGKPISPLAKKHFRCLRQMINTMNAFYQTGCNTLVTWENPVGRFRKLRMVNDMLTRGYQLIRADHCTARDCRIDPIFPKKPTHYLALSDADYSKLPNLQCNNDCTCRVDMHLPLHKKIICYPEGGLRDPRQHVIKNVHTKGMIPFGVVKTLWQHHHSSTTDAPTNDTTPTSPTDTLDALEHQLIANVSKRKDLHKMAGRIKIFAKSIKANDAIPNDVDSHRKHNLLKLIATLRTHPALQQHAEAHTANETPAPAPVIDLTIFEPIERADPHEGATPINVTAELMPPTHTIRMHSLSDAVVWHRRYGHLQYDAIRRTIPHVSGLKRHRQPSLCECCVRSKMAKSPAPKYEAERPHAATPLGEVSMDTIEYSVTGASGIEGADGARYAQVFVDGYSRHKYVYPMKRKSETIDALKHYIQDVGMPKSILTDQGTEYKGKFAEFCTNNRIQRRFSCTYKAYMNGLVERSNRSLKTVARSLLIDSNLPPNFWPFALKTAAYILNRTAHKNGPTPHQLMTPISNNHPPDISHLRIFGAPCFVYVEKDHRKPLQYSQKAEPGIFIGYDMHSPSYLIYRPKHKNIISRAYTDVIMDEAFNNASDVLLDKYSRTPDDLIGQNPFTNSAPRPRKPIKQSDVDKLFKPSVQIPLAPGINANTRFDRILVNNVPHKTGKAPKQYIQQRCKDIDGLSFNQAKHRRFIDSKGTYRFYNTADLNHDLKYGNLRFKDADAPLTIAEANYLKHAVEHTRDIHYAHSLVQTGDEPISYEEMEARPDSAQWLDSNLVEWNALKKYDCFEWVDPTDNTIVPADAQLLTSKWVWKKKPDRYKSRIVIRGFLQDIRDVGETFAPVCRMESMRTILALTVTQGWSIRQADITNAYIRAPLQGPPVFMHPPQGVSRIDPDAREHVKNGKILKLKKSLYGLKAAGRNWYLVLKKYLASQGFKPTDADPCLYTNADHSLFVGTYVDDLLIVGDNNKLNQFMHSLRLRFGNDGVKDLGQPTDFLGIQLDISPTQVKLSQPKMIERLLRRFNHTPAHRSSPMPHDTQLTSVDHSNTKPDHTEYRSLVGGLNYLATSTRADIAWTVHQLAKHMANPSHAHLRQAYRTLDYLASTKHLGPTYTPAADPTPHGYSDADWAGQPDDRRSTSGQIYMLNNACVTWGARTQKCVALSTAEAEWYALADAGKSALWLRKLFTDIGMRCHNPTRISEDNTSSIKWSKDSAAWARTRHIDIKYNAIKDWVESELIHIEYCPTNSMLADIFTKPLPSAKHIDMTDLIFNTKSTLSVAQAA